MKRKNQLKLYDLTALGKNIDNEELREICIQDGICTSRMTGVTYDGFYGMPRSNYHNANVVSIKIRSAANNRIIYKLPYREHDVKKLVEGIKQSRQNNSLI